MKKLVYLVAPLMVLPCMMSCNKAPTHKVVGVSPYHLNFTTMNDKKLEDSSFNEGQDFKFKVKAVQDDKDPQHLCTVITEGIYIYVGDSILPLVDGYKIEYTKDDATEAVITIDKSKTNADIVVEGIAAKEDNYIYGVPLLFDVELAKGQPTYGWHEIGTDLNLYFKGKGDHANPNEKSFLITDDGINYCYKGGEGEDVTKQFNKLVKVDTSGDDTVLTVNKNAVTTGAILITARTADVENFLDALSWDEIKELSVNGLAPYILNVGDEKHIKFKTEGEGDTELDYTLRILGFNHDYTDPENPDTTKVGITFQFKTVISYNDKNRIVKPWNDADPATAADFEFSSLNTYLQNTVLTYLPEDLQRNIETVSKKVGKYNKGWSAEDYSTKLFPLAAIEASEYPRGKDGDALYCLKKEGTTYEYFKGASQYSDMHDKRKVFAIADTPTGAEYWLRSPSNSGNKGYANLVDADGYFNNEAKPVKTTTAAIAPCFCI